MKLQSIIASLERKVNSVRVPIRQKTSYAIPQKSTEGIATTSERKESIGAEKLSDQSNDSLTTHSELSKSSELSDKKLSTKGKESISEDDLDSLSTATHISSLADFEDDSGTSDSSLSSDSDTEQPDTARTQSRFISEVTKDRIGQKRRKPGMANEQTSSDSDSLSESDLHVLRRHQHWERELSQTQSTPSEAYKSQQLVDRRRHLSGSTAVKPLKPKRTFLCDDECDGSSSQAPTQNTQGIASQPEAYSIQAKVKLSQNESQKYLQNRKRTWEIRSLNPEHSQYSMTSNFVFQELEKSVGFSQTVGMAEQSSVKYTGFSPLTSPSLSHATLSQQNSVQIDELSMQRFSESMLPKRTRKGVNKQPSASSIKVSDTVAPIVKHLQENRKSLHGEEEEKVEKATETTRAVATNGDVSLSPGKIKFPKNFGDD